MNNIKPKDLQRKVMSNLSARNATGALENEADFMAGAMTVMHIIYETSNEKENDKLSASIPPMWVLGPMSGRSLLDEG